MCRKNLQQKVFHSVFIAFCFGFCFFLYFPGFSFFIFLVFCDLPSLIEWQQAKSFGSSTHSHTHTHADSFSHTHTLSVFLTQYKWPPWRFAWRRKICNKIYFHTKPTQTRDTHTHTYREGVRDTLCPSCCVAYVVQHFRFRFAQAECRTEKESAKTQATTKERREKRQTERAR